MKKTLHIEYEQFPYDELNDLDMSLVEYAIKALEGSYSPYSNFSVGAAVFLDNGKVLCGANQENASSPCTTCAERTALNYAQSTFPHVPVRCIAIAARKNGSDDLEDFVSPCGMCRQVIAEVERRQKCPVRVFLVGKSVVTVFASAEQLMPCCFDR